MKNQFIVTEDHLKLLRKMWITWNDCEFGAPCVDCKRPYGNSSVPEDIAEILNWTINGDELSVFQYNIAKKLHSEMETALQIVLCTGKFQSGLYIATDEYNALSWKYVD